jgi:diguanylate cyclase (GGDEF)-like protein
LNKLFVLGKWFKHSVAGEESWRKLTADAVRSMKQFLLLPDDPELQNCGRKLDKLGAEIEANAKAASLSKQISITVEDVASKQQDAVDDLIFNLDESLRSLVNTLDIALNAGDSIADTANASSRRLRSLQEVESFEEWKAVVQGEVQGLLKSVRYYAEVSKEIHETYCEEIETMRNRLEVAQTAAKTDALTRLPNRTSHEFYLHAAIAKAAEGTHYALALLDLNGFKKINDELGHAAGDAALISFSLLLKEAVGKNGFVARLGGDEFTVVMKGTTRNLQAILDKLMGDLHETPIDIEGELEHLSASYGIVSVTGKSSYGEIMKVADDEMYAAKKWRRTLRAS